MSNSVQPERTSVTFECPVVTDAERDLLPTLGVQLHEPSRGRVKVRRVGTDHVIEAGHIVVRDAEIHVSPREGLTDRQLGVLLGAARLAFHRPPRKGDGWRYTREGNIPRWITYLSVRVQPNELAGMMSAEEVADRFLELTGVLSITEGVAQ